MASVDRTFFHNRMKTDNKELGTQQLLDALTDHLALYHRKVSCATTIDRQSKGSLKEKALQWFRGLSVEQRRFVLTVCDKNWVAVLLQMRRSLAKEGRGYFLVLPDVLEREPFPASSIKSASPSSHTSLFNKPEEKAAFEEPRKGRKSFKTRKKSTTPASSFEKSVCQGTPAMALPSLCFRKARGLLARLEKEHTAGEMLCSNLELFSSVEAADASLNWLDTVCISEDLLSNPDQFFTTMDAITYGEFLSSVPAGHQDSSWEELPWLKSMGYYSMSAFVANKVELAMWSGWLYDEGIHRPPKSLSKELRKTGLIVKGHKNDVSVMTVCKRYKDFKDWWLTLGEAARSNMLKLAVARAAKMEVVQAAKASHSAIKSGPSKAWGEVFQSAQFLDKDCCQRIAQDSKTQNVFGSYLVGLDALQSLTSSPLRFAFGHFADASEAVDYKWLLCSCLDSADTLPGNVMRRAWRVLQEVMVKSVESDLLKSGSNASQAPQWKARKESRRLKSRSTGQNNGNTNSRNEEKPESSAFHMEEKHEGTERHKFEKSKLGKKKRHVRERPKDSYEAPSVVTCKEGKISPGSTLDKERKSNFAKDFHNDPQNVKAHDWSRADCNSEELSASQSFTIEHHCLPKVDSCSQHTESNEHDLCNLT
eukprot:c11592_g1_i1 orf=3-1946(-)